MKEPDLKSPKRSLEAADKDLLYYDHILFHNSLYKLCNKYPYILRNKNANIYHHVAHKKDTEHCLCH